MPKILLAEDDNDMRRFLVKALQNAGYDVISFDNGLSAYRRLREEPFELLLTDIVMPEMDGIELARRGAQSGLAHPQGRQGAVQAVPPARPRQRGAEDARRLIRSPGKPGPAACLIAHARLGWRHSQTAGPASMVASTAPTGLLYRSIAELKGSGCAPFVLSERAEAASMHKISACV